MLKDILKKDEIFNYVISEGSLSTYKKGQIINNIAEQSYIYAVEEGYVFVKQSCMSGKELIIKIIGPGSFFLLDIKNYKYSNNQYYALAKTNSKLKTLTIDSFKNEIDSNPVLNEIWETYIYKQLNKKNLIVRDFTLFGKKGAIYSTLIRLVNTYSCKLNNSYKISIRLSHEEISQICGTTREFVSRTMIQLQKDNIIAYDELDRCIIVYNLKFLRENIHCEYCPLEFCDCT
jgi:CRP-like cAMP-binding protein